MQAKKRLAFIMVGLLAVVLVAMVGQAWAVQEVCTTDGFTALVTGTVLSAAMTNTYAYGPMTVVEARCMNDQGGVVANFDVPLTVQPLHTTTLGVGPVLVGTYICRVTAEMPAAGA